MNDYFNRNSTNNRYHDNNESIIIIIIIIYIIIMTILIGKIKILKLHDPPRKALHVTSQHK
jgi:hypothetical protein